MAASPMFLEFVLEGRPVPKGRPRFARSGCTGTPVVYTDKRTKEFERRVAIAADEQMARHHYEPRTDAMAVEVIFYLTKPKNCPKTRYFPAVRPDLDNLVKSVIDGMNGVVFLDDKQIVHLSAAKRYDGQFGDVQGPRTHVRVWTAGHRPDGRH